MTISDLQFKKEQTVQFGNSFKKVNIRMKSNENNVIQGRNLLDTFIHDLNEVLEVENSIKENEAEKSYPQYDGSFKIVKYTSFSFSMVPLKSSKIEEIDTELFDIDEIKFENLVNKFFSDDDESISTPSVFNKLKMNPRK